MENPLLQSWLHKNPKSINNPSNKSKHIKVVKENTQPKLNTFMKKSIFETLVEQVMSDDELNVIGADEGSIDSSDNGSEESGDVTITLSAEQVECLRNILAQVDGEEGEDDSFEDEFEDEGSDESDSEGESEDEEFDAFATEAIEAEEIGTPLVNQKKGNPCKPSAGCNKVAGKVTSMAKSGKANASVTDKVGNDGDEGTPLVNQKKGNPKKPSGGDNKVAGRASQVGSDLFA
jgi:hypothetical protein